MAISQGGQGRGAIFTEINITPLTDIFLVLLIIMMVIAPMFQETNKEIKVPIIKSGQSVEDNKVTVEITKEGAFFVNGSQTSPDELLGKLQGLIPSSDEKHLIVRADQSTHSSEVLKVFEAASQAGFQKLTVSGDPLSTNRQQELSTPGAPSAENPKPSHVEAVQ